MALRFFVVHLNMYWRQQKELDIILLETVFLEYVTVSRRGALRF